MNYSNLLDVQVLQVQVLRFVMLTSSLFVVIYSGFRHMSSLSFSYPVQNGHGSFDEEVIKKQTSIQQL